MKQRAVSTIVVGEIVLVVVTALAIAATPVLGEDRLQLVLPLGAAVALLAGEPAETFPRRPAAVVTSRTTGSGSGQQLDLLPAQMRCPHLYSEEIDVNVFRYAEPVDNDHTVVGFPWFPYSSGR